MGNTNDNRYNIQQIILHKGSIYIVKLFAFILVTITVFINCQNIECISIKDFIGTFTFIITTTIDCAILTTTSNAKGKIATVHLIYFILLFLSLLFVILIFLDILSIDMFSICICNLINIFCCVSPIIELAYIVAFNMQNEKNNNY